MKKSSIWPVVIMLLIALVAAGCSSTKEKPAAAPEPAKQAEKNTWELVKEKGVLVAGLDDTFAPMGYRDEKTNELIGFDIDMAEELGKRLGVKIQWQPTQWDGVILALDSKRFDVIISGMTVTEERKKSINFSTPYINDGLVMVVKKGTTGFKTAEDLKGKVVGTQAGSSGEEAVKKMEGLKEAKLYKTFPDAFNDLQIGRIPVVVVDAMTAGHYLGKRPGVFEVVGEQLTKEPMAIGIRKADVELKEAIDKAIADMQKDGTLTKISMKWFQKDITTKAE
ncbi:amino acid ABC transporter substrate-binding protein [Desulforamulus hydrothermalis]|uniref:Amino acid ABC transporter substrate-binding protein, PAAT family n=1 Tax=Desulforamulus hydrothermalis Lam5 = DSM 18033 TaxID=1121428 RepID=K8DXS9_9FIRM|nr:amino acid ABC transporter substrate-binding protein [Desulforamulus hydrothermalis]CCO07390.1 Amino acid ABC transporter substrate-binding protein, PAAT family [Desulforamulus hydrothermalis Lam5 = DSM 18033]SHH41355.1 amino acid ABC transporter substrate-binding protein, PAAT family (TC 3.A.1.3.-) [Desulforamulus hydrothermalis Lam5 = DSM 18033]